MKLATDIVQVKQDVQGESVVMGVPQEYMGHVMGQLSGAYSNKILAIIREYSTNALDSHIEANQTRPIEVTLPTLMSHEFRVQDFGTGLTYDEVRTIYSQYGASTKRHSNDFTGALGIGCKAALGYCSAFTVQSVRHGQKIIVSASRDATGAGRMTKVAQYATTEPNGTLITVPVAAQDVNKFRSESDNFFKYWPAGTVLVNGAEPKRLAPTIKLSDRIWLVDNIHQVTSRVVMGNVAYPAPVLDRVIPHSKIVAFVGLGEVGFPPSREALDDSAGTQATLEKLKRDAVREVIAEIQRGVDAAPTRQQAVESVIAHQKYLPANTKTVLKYKGLELPTDFTLPNGRFFDITENRYGSLSRVSHCKRIPLHQWPDTVWITDFTPSKLVADHKRRMTAYAQHAGLVGVDRYVLLPEGDPMPSGYSEWLKPAQVVSWAEVRKLTLEPKEAGGRVVTRLPGSYDLYTEDGYKHGVAGDDIRQDQPIFYANGNRHKASRYLPALRLFYPKFTFVCLTSNRIEKFCRLLPKAQSVEKAVESGFEAWVKTIDPEELLAYQLRQHYKLSAHSRIDPTKVKDPEVVRAANLARMSVSSATSKALGVLSGIVPSRLLREKEGQWDDPLDKYPLANEATIRYHPDETYRYMNAVYQGTI